MGAVLQTDLAFPDWTFWVEVNDPSPGQYTVGGCHADGHSIVRTGSDFAALLKECKAPIERHVDHEERTGRESDHADP